MLKYKAEHEDMREAILAAAQRLLVRYGYRKTTMDDLAREAKVGKGTIYLYFRSKEDVAISVMEKFHTSLMDHLVQILNSSEPPVKRLREMLILRILLRFDRVSNYSQSLEELFTDLRPALLARRDYESSAEAALIKEALIAGETCNDFSLTDASATAESLILATNSLLPYSLSATEMGEREELLAKANRLITLLLNGVLSRENRVLDPVK